MIEHLLHQFRGLRQKAVGYGGMKRRRRSMAQLDRSGLFDRAWYLQTYADVRDSGFDPLRHYLETGWREGRDPSPSFCTTAYLKANSDVAALGVNPLLHYVEHGKAEGRGALHQNAPLRPVFDPVEKFGPAAPCASYDLPAQKAVAWTRAGQISGDADSLIGVGGQIIAKVLDAKSRQEIECGLARLAWLSGDQIGDPSEMPTRSGSVMEMQDASFIGGSMLRIRWVPNGSSAVVVRAVQQVDGAPKLVAEAYIADELDLLDINPANNQYPLLFIFTGPDGAFLGLRHLTFPALCRGGLYYLEAVSAGGENGPFDLAAIDEMLADGLIALRQQKLVPLVAALSVVLDDADGATPMFQANFRKWLAEVMCVGVTPAGELQSPIQEYLAHAVALDSSAERTTGLAELCITADMIPSLAALCATSTGGEVSDLLAGSLIIASEDASIGTRINVPAGTFAADLAHRAGSWPSLVLRRTADQLPRSIPVLGIRLPPRRPSAEAELLIPPSAALRSEDSLVSISWLVWPEHWPNQNPIQSLQALAVQASAQCELVLIGPVSELVKEIASQLFGSRLRSVHALDDAITVIDTEYVGYLGAGILLHDQYSSVKLIEALANSAVLTASPLLVRAEKRGKGYSVTPVDSPVLRPAELLPDSFVPLREPPLAVWAARTDRAREWIVSGGAEAISGRHVCTTAVSANSATAALVPPPFDLPSGSAARAITAELVIG